MYDGVGNRYLKEDIALLEIMKQKQLHGSL